MSASEPATKKAKVDEVVEKSEDAEMKDAAPSKPEPPKELETDAPKAAGAKIEKKVWFNTQDTTLNLMSSTSGGILKSLMDGGFQFLLAGAKANVGMKSGRYMFEVKIVGHESYTQDEWVKLSQTKEYLKVGFTTCGASPIPGTDEHSVCFDSSGLFWHNGKGSPGGNKKLSNDCVAAVLLNLDEKSPNFNTVSLFKDGQRMSQPQPLPDALKGKALFPTVAFKNMTVHVNFGPHQLAPLPFTCRMFGDASAKDVAVTTEAAPKDGKFEVVVPVGLPDEGTFEWLDGFHQKNPGYTEISTRSILAWAEKSGLWRQGGYKSRTNNDKPELNFSIPSLDDGSVDKMIKSFAPMQNRNYVIMEVKGNLIKEEREALLARFSSDVFNKVASVQLGDPTPEFKKNVHDATLKQKQEQSDAVFRRKQQEEKRKKLAAKKQKEQEKARKKAQKEREKKTAELKKAALLKKKEQEAEKKAAAKAKAAAEKKEGEEDAVEEVEDEKMDEVEEKEPEVEEEEEEEEEKEEEEKDEDPPKVELTAEEQALRFIKSSTPDLVPYVLSTSFSKFSAPEKDEGFTEIRYEWAKAPKSKEYLKAWILEKKTSTRVEDLVPSAWFKQKSADWEKAVRLWSAKSQEYKSTCAKKEAAKKQKKAAAAAAVAKAAKAEADAAKAEADGEKKVEKEEAKPMEVEEEVEEVSVDFGALDIFEVDDVTDVGGGMPLFKDFGPDDWTMMGLRHELHLLAHAFRRDVDDAERVSMPLDHVAYYYNKYYKKNLTPQSFGKATFAEAMALIRDTVFVTDKQLVEAQLDDEMECLQVFVKLAEEDRRERNIRIDLGEDGARLKLSNNNNGGNQNRDWNWKQGGGQQNWSQGGGQQWKRSH